MAIDITQATFENLLNMLNQNIRSTDVALDNGKDAYNQWVAWRAQHASSALAATDLNTKSGVTWITADHIDQWGSAFAGFNHLYDAAHALTNPLTAKDCYFDWNKILN